MKLLIRYVNLYQGKFHEEEHPKHFLIMLKKNSYMQVLNYEKLKEESK